MLNVYLNTIVSKIQYIKKENKGRQKDRNV